MKKLKSIGMIFLCGSLFFTIMHKDPLVRIMSHPSQVSQHVNAVTAHSDQARVKVSSSPLLWLAGKIYPPLAIPRYPSHILDTGAGLCSERAWLLVSILTDNGIPARLIGLDGHVVAEAKQNGKWVVLDPDYGFEFDHDLTYLEDHPEVFDQFTFESEEVKKSYVEFFTTRENNVRGEIGKNGSPRLYTLILFLVFAEKIIVMIGLFIAITNFVIMKEQK